MTKKDYVLIAGAIYRSGLVMRISDRNKNNSLQREKMRRLITIDLASSLKHENPDFDRELFYEACGVEVLL